MSEHSADQPKLREQTREWQAQFAESWDCDLQDAIVAAIELFDRWLSAPLPAQPAAAVDVEALLAHVAHNMGLQLRCGMMPSWIEPVREYFARQQQPSAARGEG